jgi:2,3-bisphosphoglycerate-independent phosphoglycerate mutase
MTNDVILLHFIYSSFCCKFTNYFVTIFLHNKMNKKVLLMILDGWGNGKHDRSNAIYTAGAPNMERLAKEYPTSELLACGENVGLPDGQMGNSEVGHLNIGAGRVVYQDLVKINRACRDGSIVQNREVIAAFESAVKSGKQIHFMGLVSDGGVHSSLEHLLKLCDIAKEYDLQGRTFVHCFMDGRDTDPKSGKGFIELLEKHLKISCGEIASIVGRYYAMDRDKRWERVKEAYDLLVHGVGAAGSDPVQAVQESYGEGVTDEFIKPIVCAQGKGRIEKGDTVIFFNYRNDRAKELTMALTQQDMPEYSMETLPLHFCTMTPYDDKFKGLHILFDKDNVQNTLGEALSSAGKTQLRIAETEKYAHVTFFFSGGREQPFPNEDRILISSPKVATYDLQPEMSAPQVKDALIAELKKRKYDFIALNFANGDMVGHTGIYAAIEKAVKTIDTCVGEVVKFAQDNGYTILITADHGNADNALNPDGSPNTAHSLNPVPFVVVDKDVKSAKSGVLADIAPTVLTLMGIAVPKEMTGKVLV